MNYEVVWDDRSENELATAWLGFPDRNAVTVPPNGWTATSQMTLCVLASRDRPRFTDLPFAPRSGSNTR